MALPAASLLPPVKTTVVLFELAEKQEDMSSPIMPPRTKRKCRTPPSQQADRPTKKVRRKINTDMPTEMKIDAVIKVYQLVGKGLKKGQADKAVAKTLEVSDKALRNWRQSYDKHGLPGLQSKRQGNKNASKFTPKVQEAVRSAMKEDATLTQRELQTELREVGIKSKNAAAAHRSKCGFKPRKRRRKTYLTDAHLKARLAYCKDNAHSDYRRVFMTDEKWFYRTKNNVIEYYLDEDDPDDEEKADFFEFREDNAHPMKVMFTGVVARPVWNNQKKKWTADGKVGLWRSMANTKVAQRNSKHHHSRFDRS